MPSNSTKPLSSLKGGVPEGGGGLLKHFKDLTLHPKNAEELKGLILQLAIQGKLTAQWRKDNPDVEPASVLMDRIEVEKKELIKAKKIKKENLEPISLDENYFEIPNSWEWQRLGNIGFIFNGNSVNKAIKEAKYTNVESGYPYIGTKDVGYIFDTINDDNGVKIPFDEPKFKLAKKNTVLICSEGGSAGKKMGVVNQDCCFGNKLFAIEQYGNIDTIYILSLYGSASFGKTFKDSMTGIIGGISRNTFASLLIPIPPLEEQKAIVATVNQLFAEVEQLEDLTKQRISLKEDFVTSALRQLSTEDTNNAWAFLQPHFKSFFTEKSSVKKLRESILQLAVQGKLTKHWRSTKQLLPRKGEVPQAEGSIDSPPFKEEYPPLAGEVVKKQLNNLPHLKTFRKELRNNLTPAEASLWKMLKGKQLDHRKFRRQHSVANYILDFYCPEEKLAIELDGDGHYEERQMEYDHERDLFLNHFGIKVLRFENKWVWQNTAGVLQAIRDAFGWLEKQPPRPPKADTPPLKGGEWIEHAGVLLERIKVEKEALIKAKTIKKEKPLPAITEDEVPYELPEGWVWCRFQDLIKDLRYGTSKKCDYGLGVNPVLRIPNVSKGKIDLDNLKSTNLSDKEINDLALNAGDILLIRSNGSVNLVGRSAAIDEIGVGYSFAGYLVRARVFYYKIDTQFLHLFLESPFIRTSIEGPIRTTSGVKNINSTEISQLLIAMPPLEEQKAIVQKVNALMALCDTLEKEIETHQTTQEHWMQSCLKEVFEG
jgi:restriction endonuclease S subunit/very-short-patch-repair endonuclease